MAEEANTPAGEPVAPQTEANPTTNTNPAPEAPQTASSESTEAPKVDLHGFTEEQLADMAKFYAANGGYDKVKSRLSNPQQNQPQQPEAEKPATEPQTQAQAQPTQPPKGFASIQELQMQAYFERIAEKPEYANISEQIANGDILKEMAKMGMHPIDENFNVNVDQLNDFLALKAASVPAKPTSVEPTTTPTVEYIAMDGENITSMDQAVSIARQSTMLRAQGLKPHPAEAKALEYMKNNGFAK